MSLESAKKLDGQFPTYRDQFSIPTFKSLGIETDQYDASTESLYICGNSLGLFPKATKKAINDELDAWADRAVESHFNHPGKADGLTEWLNIDLPLVPLIAPIVGAKENEVAVMGTLTGNLNSLLTSFFKPKGKRTKILAEKGAFPSDYYAFINQVKLNGLSDEDLIQLSPREGEYCLRTEDILASIDQNADELALVCFSGVQYYTGQVFEFEKITKYAKDRGIVVGWDLAHAAGNIPLSLHDWDVDFACWCSYKYLNSGPGGIAGIFVHEKHTNANSTENYPPRLAGWWGNNANDRFKMLEIFDPIQSALSYRQSNPSVIDVVSLKTSLEIFQKCGGVPELRKKAIQMGIFLKELLLKSPHYVPVEKCSEIKKNSFTIISPLNEEERGCQISILFLTPDKEFNLMEAVFEKLHKRAIICDERRPNVIRLAPVPLYNTFEEVWYVVKRLNQSMDEL